MMTNETALMSIQMINTVNNEETPSMLESNVHNWSILLQLLCMAKL